MGEVGTGGGGRGGFEGRGSAAFVGGPHSSKIRKRRAVGQKRKRRPPEAGKDLNCAFWRQQLKTLAPFS